MGCEKVVRYPLPYVNPQITKIEHLIEAESPAYSLCSSVRAMFSNPAKE